MLAVAFLVIFAADPGGGTVPGLGILSGSILGIVLLLGLFGWVWFKPAVDDMRKRIDRAEEQRDELIQLYQREVIPVLRDVNDKLLPMLTTIHTDMEIQRGIERREGR